MTINSGVFQIFSLLLTYKMLGLCVDCCVGGWWRSRLTLYDVDVRVLKIKMQCSQFTYYDSIRRLQKLPFRGFHTFLLDVM